MSTSKTGAERSAIELQLTARGMYMVATIEADRARDAALSPQMRRVAEARAAECQEQAAKVYLWRTMAMRAAQFVARMPPPLTRDQIIRATDEISMREPGVFIKVARAVEAAHGIGG